MFLPEIDGVIQLLLNFLGDGIFVVRFRIKKRARYVGAARLQHSDGVQPTPVRRETLQ